MGKSKTTTTSTGLDPKSQSFVDAQRSQARGAAENVLNQEGSFFLGPQQQTVAQQIAPFMNPFMSNVVDATRGEFDRLRGQATLGTNEAATRAGAFGGSRQGVAEGVRLGELDRAQASNISELLRGGFNTALGFGLPYAQRQHQLRQQQAMEPFWRQQQAQGFFNRGVGPTGQVSEQTQEGSALGTLAGAGMTAAGLATGNPMMAAGGLGSFGRGPSNVPSANMVFQPPQFNPPGGLSGGGGVNPLMGGPGLPRDLPGPSPFFRGG